MISQDGYIGGIMAVQGIRDATVLLHGQNGCRTALMPSLERMPRDMPADRVRNKVYHGIAGVPLSGISAPDYSGGSQRLYDHALDHVAAEDYGLVVSICSPGASILGDELKDDGGRLMVIDQDALGEDAATGFDRATASVLERIDGGGDTVPGTVSLIGLSIMHKDWRAVDSEFRHILGKAGFDVVCTAGAGCTLDQMRRALRSEYCIVLSPEHSSETARVLEECGSTIVSTGEAPVGFDAVARLHDAVRKATGNPVPGARMMLNDIRRRSYGSVRMSGRDMTGVSFSIDALPSVHRPLASWLEDSFGMVEDGDPDILFAPGDRARLSERSGLCRRGIDIGFPSSVPDGFMKRPVLGMDGALYLLDGIFSCPSDTVDGRPGHSPLRSLRRDVEYAVADHLGQVVAPAQGLVREARQGPQLPAPHDEAAVRTEVLAGDEVDVVRDEYALGRAALDDVSHDTLRGAVVEEVVEIVEVDERVPVAGLGDPREQPAHDGHAAGDPFEERDLAAADDYHQPAAAHTDVEIHPALVPHERLEVPLEMGVHDVLRDLHVVVHLPDVVVHAPHGEIVQRALGEVDYRPCGRVHVDQGLFVEHPHERDLPVQGGRVRSPSDPDPVQLEHRGRHVRQVVVEDRGPVDGHPL